MTLNGIDVAGYQGGISQSTIAQADYTIIKVTESTNYVNPYWQAQAAAAIAAGQTVGLYHFARAGDSDAQADFFLAQTSSFWGRHRYFPVLDWEASEVLDYPAFARDWLTRVEAKTGCKAWLYAGPSTLARADHAQLQKWPAWLAAYPYTDAQGFGPRASLDWAKSLGGGLNGWNVVSWQYSDNARLSGWNAGLDASIFYGARAELAAYAAGQATPAAPAAGAQMLLPVDDPVNQNFGDNATSFNSRIGGHTGTDFRSAMNTPIRATLAGTVLYSGWAHDLSKASWDARWWLAGGGWVSQEGGGVIVVLDHGEFLTVYAHLEEAPLNAGDTVTRGQIIGKTGDTGDATGPHLHWEVIPKPLTYSNGAWPYGRVDAIAYRTAWNKAHTGTALAGSVGTETDIDDILEWIVSNEDKAKQIFRSVLEEKRGDLKNRSVVQALNAMDDNTWNTKKMVWLLFDLFKVGIPDMTRDGLLAGKIKAALGQSQSDLDKTRRASAEAASKNNYNFS